MTFVGRQMIPAPHGQLEAIYRTESEPAERIALVLHPHPLYGGTMHNKVVYRVAKALEAAGVVTLRFNFRGVEGSSGGHDQGRGEVEDARTALEWLLERQPAAREVLVAGFSFGASIGLRFGCEEPRVRRIIAVGTPARWLTPPALAGCGKPIDFIHGAVDDVAPLADVQALIAAAPGAALSLHVIPGATHFFDAHLDELGRIVSSLVA